MPKIRECERCQLAPRNPLIVCAVYPTQTERDRTLDFQLSTE
ncbi:MULTISPECIES: hypothetical protein [unclassified Trichocoleus]|nr:MULTISPECIES: hypothetical protein [unclassified Trichocoleus]